MTKQKMTISAIFMSLMMTLFITVLAMAWPVPDGGQTKCYDNSIEITCPSSGQPFYGQDAQYYCNPQSYTKLDASGNDLPDTATEWVMVRDNVTGLIWEVKTDDGSIHDKDNEYDGWYAQGGFITEVNSENFGGFSDWRLPTIKELMSIVNFGFWFNFDKPVIDTNYFPNTLPHRYWSSNNRATNIYHTYNVQFSAGFVAIDIYTNSRVHYARAVRGAPSSQSFIDNGDGTVTDTETGLMWQQTGDTEADWESALAYCENLTLAGHDDWRLPNAKELQSLVDYGQEDPSINQTYFTNTWIGYYWASTSRPSNPWYAEVVYFGNGVQNNSSKDHVLHFRAVRGGSCDLCTDIDGDGYAVEGGDCGDIDCDDDDSTVNPAALDLCDGIDNDCDGSVDEGYNLDIIFANSDYTENRLCLGDGSGGFTCSDVSTDTNYTTGVAMGFVDGDSNIDAVFSNDFTGGYNNRVCLGDGSGGFTCSDVSTDTNGSRGVAVGFVDGDSNLDAVFVNGGGPYKNRVCLGNGSGGFACSDISADTRDGFGVAVGFVDGDNNLDAVFANYGNNEVCLGNGSGGFTCSNVSSDSINSYGVALGFVNDDSNLDAVFSNVNGKRNRVCLGDGSGGFTCIDVSGNNDHSSGVALGFVDGDNNLDAVFTNQYTPNRVCLGDGSGGFDCSDMNTDADGSFGVALGFVDGDSYLDAVIGNYNQNSHLCLGDGSGSFTCSDVSSDISYGLDVVLADVTCVICTDSDGDNYCSEEDDCDDTNPDINPGADDLCDGIDNDCDGSVDEDYNLGGFCSVGVGECYAVGTFECAENNQDIECNAVEGTPAADDAICDGSDDDCDGTNDEDYVSMPTACGVGACASAGQLECQSGSEVDTCIPGTPSDEICDDGIDNDCDGEEDVSPVIDSITGTIEPTPLGELVSVSVEFTDSNIDDAYTVTFDWGDGTEFTTVNVDPGPGPITVEDTYTYTQAGVYAVTVTVSDGYCIDSSASYQYIVVYDPDGGFVTGGGWIDSPEGAYAADPTLTGKANFGFVSKYKKGATIPTGETEFQFKVADLNFHSDTYQWLVIAGARAMYKGTGTINGEGNYGFMLTAIDEKLTPSTDVDMFRIKIWDIDNGDAVVYDNQMDVADDADLTTEIGGGSIVIHKK